MAFSRVTPGEDRADLIDTWRRKTDVEVFAAARRLNEYTENARAVILAEIERRRSPEYLLAQEAAASQVEPPVKRISESPRAPNNQTAWLVQRALLAIALMVGFYVFAILIAAALLYVPYLEWQYVNRVDFRIAAACIGAALAILWALVPRVDHFQPPGPRLNSTEHPRLFQLIDHIASETGQTPPEDVYLLNEVNAWVAHRGGMMGLGSHRVMGVGLPLLQSLSVGEFEGVVAHEFGHYCSGDVGLGPWIYKTRAAIGRTIAGVQKTFVEGPFLWYGNQFLRLTHAVSRQQEFIADSVAARVAGAAAFASALRRTAAVAPLYSSYLNSEVLPVLKAGFLPPVSAGFSDFLQSETARDASERIIEDIENNSDTQLLDTHPCLRDRLAALGTTQRDHERPEAMVPASTLVRDFDRAAAAVAEFALGREMMARLKPLEWKMTGDAVFAPRWRAIATEHSQWLGDFTAETIPTGNHAFIWLGSGLVREGEEDINSAERVGRAVYVLAVGIGVLLLQDGWSVDTGPGRPILFSRGSTNFDPFAAVRALAEGTTTADAWKAQCHILGIAGRPLGNPAVRPAGIGRRFSEQLNPTPVTRAISKTTDQVLCWQCKRALPVTPATRGKRVKCPQCGTKQALPN